MFDDAKILFFLLLYFIILGTPLYLIFKLPTIVRTMRMKGLARRRNFKFERMVGLVLFELSPSGKEKRNRISGIINGKDFEIYDYITDKRLLPTSNDRFYEHHTVFVKGTEKTDIKGPLAGSMRVSIKKVNEWIDALQ